MVASEQRTTSVCSLSNLQPPLGSEVELVTGGGRWATTARATGDADRPPFGRPTCSSLSQPTATSHNTTTNNPTARLILH
jgi:hypothetical protein